MDSRQARSPASGFLNLPPEIRQSIYEIVFDDIGTLYLYRDYGQRTVKLRGRPQVTRRDVALLGTCKSIRSEALPVLLYQNRLNFREVVATDFRSFFKFLGPAVCGRMSRLTIPMPDIASLGYSLARQSRPLYDQRPSGVDHRQLRSARDRDKHAPAIRSARRGGKDLLPGLRRLHENCPHLRELTMVVDHHDTWHLHGCTYHDAAVRSKTALEAVNTMLQSWSTLESINVYFSDIYRPPLEPVLALLRGNFGWSVDYSAYNSKCRRYMSIECGVSYE